MRTVGCLVVVVMSLAAVNAPAKEWKAWIEAEDYAAQSGSQAAFYRMEETASEGRIVDNDWGREVGDFLRWSIEIPQQCDALYVTVKFARAFRNPVSIRSSRTHTGLLPGDRRSRACRTDHAVLVDADAGRGLQLHRLPRAQE